MESIDVVSPTALYRGKSTSSPELTSNVAASEVSLHYPGMHLTEIIRQVGVLNSRRPKGCDVMTMSLPNTVFKPLLPSGLLELSHWI